MKRLQLCVALAAAFGFAFSCAQAASFTYHGSLQDGGQPANGRYDLELTLYSKRQGGVVLAGPVTVAGVAVDDGNFATPVDFGPASLTSEGWVDVRVRAAGSGEFTALDDRSAVAPEGTCPGAWSLDGNAGIPSGSYLGTADNTEVYIKANGATAAKSGDNWTVSGEKSFVVEAGSADKIVVVADVDSAPGFFIVDATAPGLAIERLDWRDITRNVSRLSFKDVAAERLPLADGDSWSWIRDRLYLVLAAESAAGAEQVLDDAVAYAKERIAFGRPIGSYQAIKHDLAEVAGGNECATAGVQYAAWALSEGTADASKAAAVAQSYASEQYCAATARNIQVFGAIGFTWEMRNHLYYKRARANAELLGTPRELREQIVRILENEHKQAA